MTKLTPTKATVWTTPDGKTFPTQLEANLHMERKALFVEIVSALDLRDNEPHCRTVEDTITYIQTHHTIFLKSQDNNPS